MIDSILEGLALALGPEQLVWLVIGVGIGLTIGVIPGLGGTAGMALLLPFLFGMDLQSGAAMLVGFAAVGNTSDTFPSVLIGVPGSGGAQATIMDGYPLARKGRAGEALGAAFAASITGGIIGAACLVGLVFAVRPILLSLASPELFMLTLLGLSMVAILSRRAPIPGLMVGCFGMIAGSVGPSPAQPVYRLTFDQLYFYGGIGIIILALGFFAIPEIISLLVKNESIAKPGHTVSNGVLTGIKQTLKRKWLVLSSSLVGMFIGMIPGLGGGPASWITYGLAQKTQKNTENFGKGDVRGVIAPESANNSQDGGSLLPTLLLAVPGSPSQALMMGGLAILGLQVGPSLADEHLSFTLSFAWMLALANILACIVCILLVRHVIKVALIPAKKLAPFLLAFIILAAYQTTHSWGDIWLLLLFGVIGFVLKSLDWPRAPALVGFALSMGSERYLNRSISIYGAEWVTRPLVITIAVVIVALFAWGAVRSLVRRQFGKDNVPTSTPAG